jgi:AcrR family transcriptional regulator
LSSGSAARPARERILDAAYELFSRHGVRAVGTEELMARADVAKATFYRHFSSKDDLVLAFLDDREQRWTLGLVRDGALARGQDPTAWLLGVFDVFDDWFDRPDEFEGCSFIKVLLELGPHHPAGRACVRHLENIRGILADWAGQAGLRDPEQFARSLQILMKGSIISAAEGDRAAARRARDMACRLIDDHRT